MVECPECGKVLKNGSGLSGHLKMVHGVTARESEGFKKAIQSQKAYNKIEKLVDLFDVHCELMERQFELEGKEKNGQATFLDVFDAEPEIRKMVVEVVEARANEVMDQMEELYGSLLEKVQNGSKGEKRKK